MSTNESNSLKHITLKITSTIKEAMQVIDKGAMKIAIITDQKNHLIGILTDGDIRRGILNGFGLDHSIVPIIQRDPIVCGINESKEAILQKSLGKRIYHLPIIDESRCVIGIADVEQLLQPIKKRNKVVLMVGGLGTRLHPLTQTNPKPMIHVGNKPILETIINNFKRYGFCDFILSVNYKADVLQNYFGDGSRFGINIEYVHESKRMGTAGALSLLKGKFDAPFFVMNGDLLTNVNFEHFLDYHLVNDSFATMAVREHEYQIPYGVIHQVDQKIISITEKPTKKYFINAGIYLLNPDVINSIPQNEFFDMPALFDIMIRENKHLISFPIREYWLDIGRIEELEKAQIDYYNIFEEGNI